MIRPIKDIIYITPMFESDMTPGGLFKPDQAADRCDQGIVKYVGPEVIDVTPGDHVLFPNYCGTLMGIEGEGKIIMMAEKDITCIFESDNFKVPGLYFLGNDGRYIEANYESTIELIAKVLEETDWYKEHRAKKRRRTIA